MRVGIAIDVSTDVPEQFIADHHVHVLPSTIHMGDVSEVYDRDPQRALAFYRDHLRQRGLRARTSVFSVAEIESLFLKKLVIEYDYVFLITLTATRSATYDHAHKASFTVLQGYHAVRSAAGVSGSFALRVVDSQSLFSGPGVLAWETARLIREGRPPVDIRNRLDRLIPQLHAYAVPLDLAHIRSHAVQRGDRSINLLAYGLARAFDVKPLLQINAGETRTVARVRGYERAAERLLRHGAERVRAGLAVPAIGVSYAGDAGEVARLPGYDALEAATRERGVELLLSMMSPAAAVNVGPRTLTLAYCGDPGEFAR